MSPSLYTITPSKNWGFEFVTDAGHTYTVYFDNSAGIFPDERVNKYAVYLGFSCHPPLKPMERMHDPKVGATIMHIIANFFVAFPEGILAYVCSSVDGQDRHRQIAFTKWHNSSPLKARFRLTKRLLGETYCGILFDVAHPERYLIEQVFDDFDRDTKPGVFEEEGEYLFFDEEE